MERTTYKKHVKRARQYAKRQRGGLSQNEILIGFIDTHKMELSREDRSQALSIMGSWLLVGYMTGYQRSTLRAFRRQINLEHQQE